MKLKTPTLPRKAHHPIQANPAPVTTAPTPAPERPVAAPVAPLRRAAAAPEKATRQRNAAVMIAGVAFIVIAAAMAASVAASFDDSVDVLVAAEPIAEGQPITADHFRVVQIAAGAGDIQAVSPEQADQLVGRVAAGPIGEGSLIHPDQFMVARDDQLVVVGAALEPDQYPATPLKPGDRVRLIQVTGGRTSGDDGFDSGMELAFGEITDVTQLGPKEHHFSIRVPESVANVIAQRVAQDRLTIALLDESITLEQVDPLAPARPLVPLELDAPADETPGSDA